ncbi:MAG: type II toxin-antitoxin system VapC family toxin [Planctomycetia bacterium]|nr:type II toxin-antitoxin system VapC family toxin [Planctomycetia bacterium]
MIFLDTDHLTILTDDRHSLHHKLVDRLERNGTGFQIPLVSLEESLRGILALIHRYREVDRQLYGYGKMMQLLWLLKEVEIIPLDQNAAVHVKELQSKKLKMGTQDLKIAAIAKSHDALLLSNNLKDFKRIPGLRVESWIA